MPVLKNKKHESFAHYIAKGEKPEKAYITTGYSEKGARQAAYRLLQNVDIQGRIEEIEATIVEKVIEKTAIDEARVIEELSHSALVDIRNLYDSEGNMIPIHKLPENVTRAISAIDVQTVWQGKGEDAEPVTTKKIKFVCKKGTLELIGKHLKMFTDKVESSGPNGGPIENKWTVEFVNATPTSK